MVNFKLYIFNKVVISFVLATICGALLKKIHYDIITCGDKMDVRNELFLNQDNEYKNFTKKLLPTVEEDRIIGVRIPILRKIAKKLTNEVYDWYYFEEIMIHGFQIGYSTSEFENKLKSLDEFVPKIDNWSVCDSVSTTLKFINNNKHIFLEYLRKYMYSNNEFELRFAIVILMNYYIDDEYVDFVVDYIKQINSQYYYVNMAAAWALSNCFIKYENKVMQVIIDNELSKEVHNMLICKIRDSLRVDNNKKEYLKTLKID